MSRTIRNSSDVVERIGVAVKNRYFGRNGINHMAKDLSLLKMIVNTEDKHADQAVSSSVTATTPVVLALPALVQGITDNTRIGDSVKIVRFDGNLLFQFSTGTTTSNSSQIFNWYLVRYKKTPSSSGYSSFNISEFLDLDINSDYTPLSLPNSDTNENFQIMMSGTQRVVLPIVTVAGANVIEQIKVDFCHECNFHQEYNTSAYTGVCDNMCFLVLTAVVAANTGGNSLVVSNVRMWYVDN